MPRHLHVTPLIDPTLERVGFPLEHPYIERVWLSIAGPSSVLCLRQLGRTLDGQPAGAHVDLVELSRSLGLQTNSSDEIGRSSRLWRTLDRLVQFDFGSWVSDERLALRRRVPAVSRSRTERLAPTVRLLHHQLLDEHLRRLGAVVDAPQIATPASRLAALGNDGSRGINR